MGHAASKEEKKQGKTKNNDNKANIQRRRKGKRCNSSRINLNSINNLESCRNIDNVLSEMGVKTEIDVSSDSGISSLIL